MLHMNRGKKKRNLFRVRELMKNPSTRVPICLCLDVSGSMGLTHGGRELGYEFERDGQMWDAVEGGTCLLDEMVEGVRRFLDEAKEEKKAHDAAEVCVVTFGDDAELVMDYAGLDHQPPLPELECDEDDTAMGEGVNLALDCLERRKKEYKETGVSYFQPWLVLMTDGIPNGDKNVLERAINRTRELVQQEKLSVIPIAIGEKADFETLARFSPKCKPTHLKGMNFKAFFEWLAASVESSSQSTVSGDKPVYNSPETWAQDWSDQKFSEFSEVSKCEKKDGKTGAWDALE